MEVNWAMLAGQMIGGFVGVWILQALIDFVLTSRVMDNPVNGKMLATISAYVLACMVYGLTTNSPMGLFVYLPGALLVGYLELRGAKKVQRRMNEADEAEIFL